MGGVAAPGKLRAIVKAPEPQPMIESKIVKALSKKEIALFETANSLDRDFFRDCTTVGDSC